MNKNIEIYVFHTIDYVIFVFFKEDLDKYLKKVRVSKKQLGERMVETFCRGMISININLSDIKSIYLNSSFSTWNASRLVTLFVKTISSFVGINLFSLKESQDKSDIEKAIKDFADTKKHFKLINNPEDEETLYKSWTNINI